MCNNLKRCIIFAGGEPLKAENVIYERIKDAYVICADKGQALAQALGVKADMVIGDFDSLGYVPDSDNVKVFPVEKDDTDLMLAVKQALDMGFVEFDIYGATGGRLDHMIGNIQCLDLLLEKGARGQIISDNEYVTLYKSGHYSIPRREGFTLSLFAYSPKVSGLTVKGTKYTAENAVLTNASTLGVSNEFLSCDAEISFNEGTLLVICSRHDK